MEKTLFFCIFSLGLGVISSSVIAESLDIKPERAELTKTKSIEEVHIWGKALSSSDAGYVSPTSILLANDMVAINAATTEDLVKFEPSLVIRRRFIGDSNGTLGIRGSNMFQTSRSMVYADGVPLHYLLQSRWNGAPRWTMVSASEIAQVEVIYGPFSAEYSGNAMGGVVLIETALPQKREFNLDVSYFNQEFRAYGFDDRVDGAKGFLSYGDKIGDLSVYLSYNRLHNTSQPQTFRDAGFAPPTEPNNNPEIVSGAIQGLDARGRDRFWYGDTGVVETTTNNYKAKIGYDFGQWQTLLNVAYEDRVNENTGQSYITESQGNTVWSGIGLVQSAQQFSFSSRRINQQFLNRDSLSIGFRAKGSVTDSLHVEANINQFDILNDESRSSALNPQDPNFTPAGQITDFIDSGWRTASLNLKADDVFITGLEIISGVKFEQYRLNLDVFNSTDYNAGIKNNLSSQFGGQTEIASAFTQANWNISTHWDAAIGLRYESFKSSDGYFDNDDPATPQLDVVDIPEESKTALSPKLSVGYRPNNDYLVRYSVAKASRFPIVEELFRQYEDFNTVSLSNPNLEPEEGLHQNISVEKLLDSGYVRVNFFKDIIENTIESQTDRSVDPATGMPRDVRSFVPIGEVKIEGVELVVNTQNFIFNHLDLRFNASWLDAKIVDNSFAEGINPANTIEGNTYPRLPKWRSNILTTYHVTPVWHISANLQYASDSFGRTDNTDTVDNVFGAQDSYTRVGVKTGYTINDYWKVSVGIDNLTNEIAYVAHPWPGRTVFLNLSLDI